MNPQGGLRVQDLVGVAVLGILVYCFLPVIRGVWEVISSGRFCSLLAAIDMLVIHRELREVWEFIFE